MNPFRFDGRDGVRYDASTGLDWMSVRAYDPSVGRFLSRDPLGRAPLFFADNPYVYAGNNPLSNVDPSGQYRAAGFGSKVHESWKSTKKMMARVVSHRGTPSSSPTGSSSAGSCGGCQIKTAPTAPQMHIGTTVTVTAAPQNYFDLGYLIEAIVRAGGGLFLIAAAGSTWEVNPLGAVALFVNGLDQLVHAAALIARITKGPQSGVYGMLAAFAVILDYVATLTDLVALDPVAAGDEVILPLLKNTDALVAIGTLLGVDLVGDIEDFKTLIDGAK